LKVRPLEGGIAEPYLIRQAHARSRDGSFVVTPTGD
jgi:hypothetical protein